MGNSLKLPSPTKLARLGHFPPASQAGRLAVTVFYVYVFSLNTCSFNLPHRSTKPLLNKAEVQTSDSMAKLAVASA
jgi:hypothetical protein